MMVNWGMGCDSDGKWFGKPSYLGFWIAAYPWGPWNQVYEETAWAPEGDSAARAYQPQIIPKWIAKDGKSFLACVHRLPRGQWKASVYLLQLSESGNSNGVERALHFDFAHGRL